MAERSETGRIGFCSHNQPEGWCQQGMSSGCEGPTVTVEDAVERAYRQGFDDGFVTAHIDEAGFPDEADTLRLLDTVAKSEGWSANRDALLRSVP